MLINALNTRVTLEVRGQHPLHLGFFLLLFFGLLDGLPDSLSNGCDALSDGSPSTGEAFYESRGELLDLFGLILGEG